MTRPVLLGFCFFQNRNIGEAQYSVLERPLLGDAHWIKSPFLDFWFTDKPQIAVDDAQMSATCLRSANRREARVIRQNNEQYRRSPLGFELDTAALSSLRISSIGIRGA